MISRLISLLIIIFTSVIMYRFRYRIMNIVLGTSWIRNLIVSGTMQIPALRERLMNRMVPF